MTQAFDPTFVTSGVHRVALPIANAYILSSGERWALVDAGLPGSAPQLQAVAEDRGWPESPEFIVLTHGHFDHVGALKTLLKNWDVPVYAHVAELPYVSGKKDYPAPNAKAGGLMSALSPLYPRRALKLRSPITALPSQDGRHDSGLLPGFADWRWFHTPGHTAGHISLWRETDRTLIAGDAVTTTHQASVLEALLKPLFVCGPPPYFTSDWFLAQRSVKRLAALQPELLATGHGIPMRGPRMRHELSELVVNFERLAVPANRRGESLIPSAQLS